MMRRAGLWDDRRYLSELEGSLEYVENSPGARLMSAVDASLAAPFIDSAVHRQQTNLSNTSITYYIKGELHRCCDGSRRFVGERTVAGRWTTSSGRCTTSCT